MAKEKSPPVYLTKKDFVSDQDVRWCPGCGDYAILSQVQKVLPELGIPRENFVFVSGIGCAARLPYYVNTYGFHTIHGRAPAIATGVKAYNPELQVFVITGDGDALSIGGNHLLHALRRNIDMCILLFNNRIYGLTKGQYSPTSEFGKKTKSSPYGSIDYPLSPINVALGAEATFIARSVDTDIKHLSWILGQAARHKGAAFVEILQNCVIFNDKGFGEVSDRQKRSDFTVNLEHGKALIYGADQNKGIRLVGSRLESVSLADKNVNESDLLVHDETGSNPVWAHILGSMEGPDLPVPLGIFRAMKKPTYDQMIEDQINSVAKKGGVEELKRLISGPETWTVEAPGVSS